MAKRGGAGALRHRLRIEQVTETANTFGEPVETWSEFATVWGSLSPVSGRERFLGNEVIAEVSAIAKIRYLKGLTPKMRIVFELKNYHIVSIQDIDMRHRDMVLELLEGADDG